MNIRTGKLKPAVTERSVRRVLGSQLERRGTGLSPLYGCAGRTLLPQRAVYGLEQQLLAGKVCLSAISFNLLLPEGTEEEELRQLMQELKKVCEEEGLKIASVQTIVSPAAGDFILTAAAAGTDPGFDAWRAAANKNLPHPSPALTDLDVVVAGYVALEGSAMLARRKRDELLERYAPHFLEEAADLFEEASLDAAKDVLCGDQIKSARAAGEGGIFAALWDIAQAGKTGLRIRLKSIPIRQHSIEVCEFFNLNPYMLRSIGSMVLLCSRGEETVSLLKRRGVVGAVVGKTTDSHDRIICYDDEIRYLEPSALDAYYKVN